MLATDITNIFGQITPPVGGMGQNPVSDLTSLISLLIRIVFIVAGILLLIYLLWGALDVIISGGDKEKLSKAQNKITNALIGIILMVAAIAIFGVITGDVLGIIKNTDKGWIIDIPSFKPSP